MADTMTIEILEDGTIKVDSGPISQQSHMNAEAFLRNVAQAAPGGKQERKHKAGLIGAVAHTLSHLRGAKHHHQR